MAETLAGRCRATLRGMDGLGGATRRLRAGAYLGVLAGLVALAACSVSASPVPTGSPSASGTATPTIGPTPSATPTPGSTPMPTLVPDAGLEWAPALVEPDQAGGRMADVVAGGPGLVGVGWAAGDVAAAWWSADGRVWTRVRNLETRGGEGDEIHAVVAAGPGLVAVGRANRSAPIWSSADGLAWRRIDLAEFNVVLDGVAGGSGLVRVGYTGSWFVWGHPITPTAWTSPDGVEWTARPFGDETWRFGSVRPSPAAPATSPGESCRRAR